MSRVFERVSRNPSGGQQLQPFANTQGKLTAKQEAFRKKWGNAYDELNTSSWNEELKATQREGNDAWTLAGTGTTSPSGGWLASLWGVVEEGTGPNQRIGREIYVKNFFMKLKMNGSLVSLPRINGEPGAVPIYRIIVGIDKRCDNTDGGLFAAELLQLDATWTAEATYRGGALFNAQYNLSNAERFTILDDFFVKALSVNRSGSLTNPAGGFDIEVSRSYDTSFIASYVTQGGEGEWQDFVKNRPFVMVSCNMGLPDPTNITPTTPGTFDASTAQSNVFWQYQMAYTDVA